MFTAKVFVVAKYWISLKYTSIGNRINNYGLLKNVMFCCVSIEVEFTYQHG